MTVIEKVERLNDRDIQVFQAMRELARRFSKTPSQQELADYCACDKATINRAIAKLERQGYIATDLANVRRSPRSYRITNFKRGRKATQ